MEPQIWSQVYNPTGSALVSTILAAMPVIVLLGAIGIFELKAHLAALLGLAAALLVAILVFGMPSGMATMSAVYGAAFGLFPIGWIILNVIFLYQLTKKRASSTSCGEASATSAMTAASSFCSLPSVSAHSSRVPPASGRPLR